MENLKDYFFKVSVTDHAVAVFFGPVLVHPIDAEIYTIFKSRIMPAKEVLAIMKKTLNRENENEVEGEIIYNLKMEKFINTEIQ